MECDLHWKDMCHLFMNGAFMFQPKSYLEPLEIKAYNQESNIIIFDGLQEALVEECVMYARDISDMTHKERCHANKLVIFDECNNLITETIHSTLYLLSIGVYPFEANNYRDIVWRKENEH